MQAHYHAIYLSPHLDDAALSCGGQIAQHTDAGQHVLVVTITAGDPPSGAESAYIAALHTRWELEHDVVAARRAEDIAACRILGADWLHWGVPDCIYRFHPETGEPFYTSDADIFGDVHPAERSLIESLAAQMADLPAAERVFAPLTLGHHVDHLLTRQAAERVFRDNLYYYEDYPYAQKEGALEAVIEQGDDLWVAKQIALSPESLQTKIDAIAAFRSQLSTFWQGRDELERQVTAFSEQVGGERVWRKG